MSVAAKFWDRCLFRFFDGSWKTMSYGAFFSLTENIMALLTDYEVRKGDRIAIVSENRPEWCASYIAAVCCGCIAVPIDIQLGSDEIRNLIMDSGTKTVFCSNKTESNILSAIEGTAIKEINFDTKAAPSDFPAFQRSNAPALHSGSPLFSRHVVPRDIASIIYTSGTTGKPKGVLLTHSNFCSDAEALIRVDLVTQNDNVLAVLPLHHTYPFMCTFLVPLFLGATITFGPGLKASDLLSAIKETGVTVLVGVPRLFDMLSNGILSRIMGGGGALSGILSGILRVSGVLRRKFGLNIGRIVFASVHKSFPGIKFFTSGGAPLSPRVMSNLEALGFTVLEGYGLTETAPVITFNPIEKRKPGSAGKPLPGVEIKILGDGEILAKGPMVMKGYFQNEDATREVLKDGWLFTGDLGHIDEDGYLFITGRKKEVIVLSSGKNIYPEEVENAYIAISLIKEICVSGSERNGTVDAVQAVIVPDFEYARQHSIGNINDELSWKISEVSSGLPEYMRIRGYTLSSGPLPRTPLGKLRRFMVRDFFQEKGQPSETMLKEDRQLMEDPVGRKVVECIMPLVDDGIIVHASDNLELDLGFDSLSKIELVASLESSFASDLPETFISAAHTVEDIVAALKSYQGVDTSGSAAPLLPDLKKSIDFSESRMMWKAIFDKGPSQADANKIVYAQRPAELVLIYVLVMGLKLFCKLMFRLKAEGLEHIPEEGPFVITPNHASYLDGFIIAASLPFSIFRKLHFLGMQEFFTGGVKSWFARISHVIPIDAEVYLNKALQLSSYVLKSRKSLCIFPEGGRSFDGSVMPFKKGIGVLSLEMNVPVIPAFIDGTFSALPRGAFLIRPVPVRVVFGEKILPSRITVKGGTADFDEHQVFSDDLRKHVIELAHR